MKSKEIAGPLCKAITALPRVKFNYDEMSHAFMRAIRDVQNDDADYDDEPRVDSPTIEEVIEKPTPPLQPPKTFGTR